MLEDGPQCPCVSAAGALLHLIYGDHSAQSDKRGYSHSLVPIATNRDLQVRTSRERFNIWMSSRCYSNLVWVPSDAWDTQECIVPLRREIRIESLVFIRKVSCFVILTPKSSTCSFSVHSMSKYRCVSGPWSCKHASPAYGPEEVLNIMCIYS